MIEHDNETDATAGVTLPCSRPWTRRDLLIRGGQTVAVAGLAAGAGWSLYDSRGDAGLHPPRPVKLSDKDYFAKVDWDAAAPRIAVAHGRPDRIDDLEHVERMVRAAVGGLDPSKQIERFIARDDVVMIKPNVGFDRHPKLGATTNPQVVRALIRLCKEAGAKKVIVADNPIENPAACFARSGIKAAVEAEDATLVIHAKGHDAPVQIRSGTPDREKGEILGTWPIFWEPLSEADKVIGVPVIKNHNLCFASMSMKNWYGLLSGRRNQFHQAIHEVISDLGFMMRPTLIVADGTRVMLRNGPTGGRVDDVKIGGVAGRPTVVASVDQVGCDYWCHRNLLGGDPEKLTYLELAHAKFGHDETRPMPRKWEDYGNQQVKEQTA